MTQAGRVVFGLIVLVWLSLLLKFAAPQLTQVFQPDGDFAADMLLVNQLYADGYLLTGHYSRFGFNHPGPSFLYINALFEQIGTLTGLPRANAWLLSCLFVNFAFLLLIAWTTARLFERRLSVTTLAAVMPLSLLLGSQLFFFWMPCRLVLPFAAFFLTIVLVVARGLRFLPLSMTLACLLIHGYITMPIFTLPLLLLAVLFQLWRTGWRLASQGRWLLISLAIGAVFLLPILLDALVNPQPNLLRILDATSSLAGADHATLQEVSAYAVSYWSAALAFLAPASLAFVATLGRLGTASHSYRLLAYAVVLAIFVSVAFVLYHLTVPKPLHPFMGLYYMGVPLALSVLLLHAALDALRWRCGAFLLVAGMLTWLSTFWVGPMAQRDDLREIGDFLTSHFGPRIVLDYPEHNEQFWAASEGLLLYLKDRGIDACVARPELDFMYTPRGVCPDEPVDVYLEKAESCAVTDCLFSSGELALAHPPLARAGEYMTFPACQLPHQEPAIAGEGCRIDIRVPGWATFGPYVKLFAGRYRFEIDYASSQPRGRIAGQWDVAIGSGQTLLQSGPLRGTDGLRERTAGEFVVGQRGETEIRTRQEEAALLTIYGIRLTRLAARKAAE